MPRTVPDQRRLATEIRPVNGHHVRPGISVKVKGQPVPYTTLERAPGTRCRPYGYWWLHRTVDGKWQTLRRHAKDFEALR